MQPKFTLDTMGTVLTRFFAFAMIFIISVQVSNAQTKEELLRQQNRTDAELSPVSSVANPRVIFNNPVESSRGTVSNRTTAPTIVSSGNSPTLTNNNQNATISFNFRNNNAFDVKITDIASICAASVSTDVSVYYKNTAINGAPGAITAANGWNLFGSATIAGIGNTVNNTALQPFLTGLSLVVPAGATYGIIVQAVNAGTTTANLRYSTPTGTPPVFSNGGCDIISGVANVGYGGVAVPGAPTFTPRGFIGSVTFDQATCVPVAAEAPIISPLPTSTCAGSPVTLSVIGGNLNGAASWRWYTGSCGGTLVGTGNSITVSPGATTTYFVRGEGGCAPAPGACATRVVTVNACTCVSPESATICEGQIQKLTLSGTGTPAVTAVSSGAITVSVPDASAVGATSTLAVPLPSGAVITSMSVNFNMTHTWVSDMVINLRAPNGNVLNLVNQRGGSGDNFTNTTISSASSTSLATGAAPFTGTWAADAAAGVGPTGNASNVNNWAALWTGVVSGNYVLAMRDLVGGDVGTLTSWSITINYTVNPTATWTGPAGTIFQDPAATVPYVTGTQANSVFVKPTVTSTYTANTIVGGACAGQTINVPVTVNPLPTVAVSPNPGGCAPVTLTASGATVYTWSPSAGLNATTGSPVVAAPSTNTTYTVTGTSATTGCSNTTTVPVNGISTAAVMTAPPAFVSLLNEGFNTVAPLPAGWFVQNNSAPLGATSWFQGNSAVFPSQSGAPTAYIAANWQNTTTSGSGTISTWLLTPNVALQNGDQLTFWTRTTTGQFPDRLEVRWSANGASTNVGSTSTSVGDFSTLLLSINPTLTTTGYPTSWTRFTVTISGLGAPTSGRVGFRYWVTDGGGGANSDYIGLDEVQINRPLSGVCPNTVSTIAVNITGGISPYTLVYTNGSTNFTFPGYTSGTPIQVSPAVTTSYTIVSVTGANGCAGIGNTGTATINVVQPPAITSQPTAATTCAGGNATFTVGATPAVATTTFQWQLSTDGGATWTNLANAAPYSGVTTATLTITGATAGMHNYRYRVIVGGQCPPQPVTSAAAVLNVNVPPAITTNPTNLTRCLGTSATFTAAASVASGNAAFSYQWQVSVDGGITFSNISGATSASYTITSVTQAMNGNRYRCVVTVAPCATTATTTAATLTVLPLPNVTISSPVTRLVPGRTTTITASSTPAAAVGGWAWTLNGSAITGTTNSQTVNIDGVGTYQATVTDINGCVNKSNTLQIGTEASDRLWIYPNPTTGAFQVRLYYSSDVAEIRAVHIYNQLGQIIMTKEFTLVTETPEYLRMDFDLSKQAAGVYVVKVVNKYSGVIKSGLVIKQ